MGASPQWSFGYVPTPAQFNQWFANKQDDLGLSQSTIISLDYGAGSANGFATLDSNGKIPIAQVPSTAGVTPAAAPANQFCTGINSSGTILFSQPAFANLTGVVYGTVTLNANQTTTTKNISGVTSSSTPFLSPSTANAAAQMALAYPACISGSLYITHGNNSNIDQTFYYFIIL